ncbi:MAG: nucleotidyltransferase domain-containing protein [Myxococcales bacterium]|nr:nucleotidyltransferase domain-containing protein [Myxococcales bacterium]
MRELSSIDPLGVPLPSGTEVTTRVDRVLSPGRRVPQGAVGRVTAARGDELDVTIVGVGVLRYARSELVPRKMGQLRYAQRRAGAWEALRPTVVLEATVGSRAWGLADEGSDHDLRGVFVLPLPWASGLAEPPRDLVSEDGSATYWEVGKAIRQALRADPNTLELLYLHTVRPLDPIGAWILAERDAFASAEIYGSFGRYALSQLARLVQSQRLAEHRAVVLDWLRRDPAPDLDTVAERLARAIFGATPSGGERHPEPQASRRTFPTEADAVLQAKEYVKQLYRSLYDQGLLAHRDYPSLVRFAREHAADLDLPSDLRPKNAYNLVRLIGTAIGWLRSGEPTFEVTGAFRDLLLSIKKGELSLDQTLREAEVRARELEAARQSTPLPRRPDLARADALLRRIGAEAARRWVLREPGPLGRDAPAPPAVALDDERAGGTEIR